MHYHDLNNQWMESLLKKHVNPRILNEIILKMIEEVVIGNVDTMLSSYTNNIVFFA